MQNALTAYWNGAYGLNAQIAKGKERKLSKLPKKELGDLALL